MPSSLGEQYADVVLALEAIETRLRLRAVPSLVTRPAYKQHCTEDSASTFNPRSALSPDFLHVVLHSQEMKSFSISLLPHQCLSSIISLDLSNNELMELPGMSSFSSLEILNLERNWFNTLPDSLPLSLVSLNASRNFLKPNRKSLQLEHLQTLLSLRHINIKFNKKCGKEEHSLFIKAALPQLTSLDITISLTLGAAAGFRVGSSAALRDATLLRSQLEPWGTVALRRRLVSDFGCVPSDPSRVDRAEVMAQLLSCYEGEQQCLHTFPDGGRTIVYVDGVSVSEILVDRLLDELRAWVRCSRRSGPNTERTSISAESYMILRSPAPVSDSLHGPTSSQGLKAKRSAAKLSRNRALWDLAYKTLHEVDALFAESFTELAVTYGFRGSPHIDKQNSGPFYGLSLGDFSEGEGGIRVECSARVVAQVNTRNRLGKVDGRYPHWVAPWREGAERFSLIFYETGGKFVEPGPAVFSVPCEEI